MDLIIREHFIQTCSPELALFLKESRDGSGGGSVVVDLLFIVASIVGVCNCSMFCCTLLYAHSSFAIILMRKSELAALLSLSSWCLVIVVWLLGLSAVCDCGNS